MARLNTPKILFLAWLALVIGAFTIPGFFAPPDAVDLAPLAGLIALALILAALITATVAFFSTMQQQSDYDPLSLAAGVTPMIMSALAVLLTIFG